MKQKSTNSIVTTTVKKSVVKVMLMAACCLGSQSSYASPFDAFKGKKCPDCGGYGRVENWYGGIEICQKCGGDGKVYDPFRVAGAVLFVLVLLSRACGGKKES